MKKNKYVLKSKKITLTSTIAILTALSILPVKAETEDNQEEVELQLINNKSETSSVELVDELSQNQSDLYDETRIQNQTENDVFNEDVSEDKEVTNNESNVEEINQKELIQEELTPSEENLDNNEITTLFLAPATTLIDQMELSEGNSSQKIKEFKEDLTLAGFTPWTNPNENYGPETVVYVKNFQTYYGLDVTGKGDIATINKLAEVLNSPYQLAKSGREIQEIKVKLKTLGFADHWNIPNINYGPETVDVVKSFQDYYGLVINGIVDSVTLSKINEVFNAPYTLGMNRPDIKKFKEDLTAAGFTPWTSPNDYFGPETVIYVTNFQTYYELLITSNGDTATKNKLSEVLNSPYQLGKSSSEIQKIKVKLKNLGYADHWNIPNNNYGPETVDVVKSFQSENDLVSNGIVDSVTLNKINELISMPYILGMNRPDIKEFKEDLTVAGFTPWTNPNKNYGPETVTYVKNFQRYYGLSVTGNADDATKNKLAEVLNSPYQLGNSSLEIKELKRKFKVLGFANHWKTPNNNYGPETVEVVKAFQSYYGLVPNGIIDSKTLEKIDILTMNIFQIGDSDPKVSELKSKLKAIGFIEEWNNPGNHYDSETAGVVEKFQKYYGLLVNGVFETSTSDKIDEILKSTYQLGNNNAEIQQIKVKLMNLGFAPQWTSPNTNYGPETVDVVKNFQNHFGLVPNGIVDSVTLQKINSILASPYQIGNKSLEIQDIKTDLMLLGFANQWYNPTDYYGPQTFAAVQNFQKAYKLPVSGIIDEITYSTIKEKMNNRIFSEYDVSFEEALDMQMRAIPQTDKNYAYVSADYINNNGVVTADVLNVRSGNSVHKSIIGTLTKNSKVKIIEEVDGWYRIEYFDAFWVDAAREDVSYYLNPNNFLNDKVQSFQFLNLSRLSGVTPTELNRYLKGKGILEGMGQAFIDAGRIYGVNEVYLLAHAVLETGYGTSKLATGIEVNGTVVYNMFGIGAYDKAPNHYGSIRAYEEGWTTPEQAIIGGARFIGNNYIQSGQNTLYKMRWNPTAMGSLKYATHQYATDIGWAYKQVSTINNLYNDLGISNIYLDIPIFN